MSILKCTFDVYYFVLFWMWFCWNIIYYFDVLEIFAIFCHEIWICLWPTFHSKCKTCICKNCQYLRNIFSQVWALSSWPWLLESCWWPSLVCSMFTDTEQSTQHLLSCTPSLQVSNKGENIGCGGSFKKQINLLILLKHLSGVATKLNKKFQTIRIW